MYLSKTQKETLKKAVRSRQHNDVKLTGTAIIVYYYLIDHANYKTGSCYPSEKTLAEECGVCKRSVVNAIATLERAGLIQILKVSNRGQWEHNRYIIVQDKVEGEQAGERSDQTRPGAKNSPKQLNTNKFTLSISSTISTHREVGVVENSQNEKSFCEFEKPKTVVREFKPQSNEEFDLAETCSQYQHMSDKTFYNQLKKKYFVILNTAKRDKSRVWKINGENVTSDDVIKALTSLSYKDLLNLAIFIQSASHMTTKGDNWRINKDFAFYLTALYNKAHNITIEFRNVEPAPALQEHKPAHKNAFCNFQQREYDFEELERLLLARSFA